MIQNLSLTELKSFNKHTYKEMMIPQMKKLLPDISDTIISSTCHYISNALNNESQKLVGQRKRNSTRNKTEETVSTSTTKTDALLAQVDDLDLSELCRTINEPSDHGDENIDETVSANTLNDSLTIEKEIHNEEAPSQMTEFDISSIDNEQVDAKKKKAKTGKSSKFLKKTNNEFNSDVQCICKGTGKSSLIQCSWCQMWLHVTCVNLSEKETIGFWVCPTCRELPRTVLKISEQLDAVIKNNMDLVRDTAAKIVRIHELEAENKRLRDSVKSISTNNQDTEIHVCEEAHLSTSTPTENSDVRKPKGTLLIGSSIIRDINKRRFECDTDPMCIRGGKVNDISSAILHLPENTNLENIIIQVGSNDCVSDDFDKDTFREEYCALVEIARSASDNVVISGICPRLDDKDGHISAGNRILSKIAHDENLYFVDNDSCCRMKNKSINMRLYHKDGVHLNLSGSYKLAENIGITCKTKTPSQSNTQQKRQVPKRRHTNINNSILPTFNSDITRGSQQRTDTRPTFRENRGQFHKQNNTNNMEYYNIRNRDMGRNDVWDMSRDDVWDMSSDDVWDLGSNDVCCGYCGERNHTHSECKHGTHIQCDSCHEYGHKAKMCKVY